MTDSGSKLSSAISEAQNIIEAAEQRAQLLEAKTKRNFEEAYQQGYAAGLERGFNDATQQAVHLLEDSGAVGDQLAKQLALAICQMVINEHIKVDGQTAKAIAIKALQEAVVGETAIIMANPDDCAMLTQFQEELRRIAGGAGIRIEADASIGKGGCIVKTDFGEVDARIETLLKGVRTRLGLG